MLARSVGSRSVDDRVIVVKSPYRTFSVTVRPTTPLRWSREGGIDHPNELAANDIGIGEVFRKGFFMPDRLRPLIDDDGPIINGEGKTVELGA